MGKPTICIGENKDADLVTVKLISAFVFATPIVQFLFYLNPKYQASSSFLCLYRPVCVRPVFGNHIVGFPTRRLILNTRKLTTASYSYFSSGGGLNVDIPSTLTGLAVNRVSSNWY